MITHGHTPTHAHPHTCTHPRRHAHEHSLAHTHTHAHVHVHELSLALTRTHPHTHMHMNTRTPPLSFFYPKIERKKANKGIFQFLRRATLHFSLEPKKSSKAFLARKKTGFKLNKSQFSDEKIVAALWLLFSFKEIICLGF